MSNSLILNMLSNAYEKYMAYYKYSRLYQIFRKVGQSFGRYAANSSILGFFDKEWGIGSAWKGSLTFRIITLPLRLSKYALHKFSDRTNRILEGSKVLSVIRLFIEMLCNMGTRVYGLLFLTFAATHEVLGFVFKSEELPGGTESIIRAALFLIGAMLILINRQVKSIIEGSIFGGIAYDFFMAQGNTFLSNSVKEEDSEPDHIYEVTAIASGIILGVLGYLLQPMTFVLAAGAFIGSILVLWRYEIGVFAVVGFIPLAPTMALLGLILLTAVSYTIRLFMDNRMRFSVSALDCFVFLFGIVLFYSTIASYTPAGSTIELLIHAAFIIFYFILMNTIKTKNQLYTLIMLLVLSTAVISVYGLYQMKTVGATSEAWVDTTLFEDIKARIGSTFENPNVLGEYLVLIIPVAIAMLWGQKGWVSKLTTLGLTAIMLICLVYTYSRGAYIGLMLALALFAVLRDRRFVILGVIGLLLLPFVLPQSVINRFTSIGNLSDTSSFYRISVWLGSLKIVKDYWPSGIGLGLEPFKLIYPKYSLNAAYAHHSHNIYIQLLIETGIAGFLMFFAIIAVYYKTMLAGFYKTRDRFVSTFMIAAASGMAGYLAQGIVENIWYNNKVLLTFWVMLALGMTAKSLISKDNEVPDL